MSVSTRKTAQNLWHVLFQLQGSIWSAVLPYCIINCMIMILIEILTRWDIRIAFSPSGHGLMTLIVSFLVISKVNLAYDRYMQCRQAIGHSLSALRELNQTALLYTEHLPPDIKLASEWRRQTAARIVDLMECTIRVIKDAHQANYLARNVDIQWKTDDDPMLHVQALRSHLYTVNLQVFDTATGNNNTQRLEMFERMRMIDLLNEFVVHYRNLLKLASTPLPFQLVQMGRTFLFLWTFTIPLVLRGVVDEMYSCVGFVFFLTYGFVGLEIVAMKLMNPFGDGRNDLNVTGMKEATIVGIEKDMQAFGESTIKLQDKRLEFSRQKPRPPMQNNAVVYDGNGGHTDAADHYDSSFQNVYHPMGDHNALQPAHS